MDKRREIEKLEREIEGCRKILTALGDEVRQHIILQMLHHEHSCSGMRVPEITELTNLSRPAVSHHLQILKEAGIMKVRKEGAMNFYYFTSENTLRQLVEMLQHADRIINGLSEES